MRKVRGDGDGDDDDDDDVEMQQRGGQSFRCTRLSDIERFKNAGGEYGDIDCKDDKTMAIIGAEAYLESHSQATP